jgi:serine/threonine protein kinase
MWTDLPFVLQELKALVKMDSPHVVKMLGAHLDASSECVAMVLEYVNGGSLQDFIHVARGERILPESALANIARDISRALAYCHGLNMLHLDVKPSNILLGLDGTAKLADFGLARQMDMNKKAATFVGTTKYLSPERLRGEEYSFPADVWGLGLCLLTAALGEYPFDSKDAKRSEQNEQGVYWSLLERLEKSSMAQLPHELFSTQATEFCAACMELDPALRPTALALCDSAWFEGRSEARRLEKRPRKDAAIAVLAEVCDAIVKALGKMHTSEVNVETGLVLNLARQLSVSEEEVRLALEASAARLSAQTPVESVLSGRAKDSTGSSFAANRSTTPFSPNTGVSLS